MWYVRWIKSISILIFVYSGFVIIYLKTLVRQLSEIGQKYSFLLGWYCSSPDQTIENSAQIRANYRTLIASEGKSSNATEPLGDRKIHNPLIPPPVINNDEPLLFLKSSWKNNSCVLNFLLFREAGENMRQIF